MKRIILTSLLLAATVFARTETMELTGEHAQYLGNPFKNALGIEKKGSINIFSDEKDIVLKVESNLTDGNFLTKNLHPEAIVFKNKSIENVVKNFYAEDYIVNYSKENAVIVNVVSGVVELNYSNDTNQNNMRHLMGIEVKLVLSISRNGQVLKKEVVMDHKLNKAVGYKGFLTSDDFDFDSLTPLYSAVIIENQIFNSLKEIRWKI